ncbi:MULTISPECIES: dienelactone hydrolase family protein [Pseudomonas]|jgi:dienelactone hydrolase|uniref:Dienelactone hydrolase family protein n=1 Tax=Pseudomonas protegens (strain DSM 19095 / LMG 27888 / CFBP 6595 / CHA0) TaxID=1124983 RepID=A0A2C9ES08_PSEPH|nr:MULTISPECIES: dienelactone hydrolase family protein [Pseudomonas]GED74819.1 dienelactone hydrolase [Pseudomonas fluorescens]AGL86298.1 dienelactone hydrolase family protein [Pseudomonas protegens CHA0]AQT11416.1 dienelactone hydrolase [Pseudomonas protegens]MBP5102692.1 dienelactone hydrolase family protein [Pseudomonas protegens]MBP5110443.1 dienelactone hydrolase family protein [Pseudomonas protegens]
MRMLVALVLLTLGSLSQAAIKTQEIPYRSTDGTQLIGYYAYDDALQGPRPGIVVVHEWWGLNDYAKRRARDLAALGYSALAIDMYGQGKHTEHPADAMAFMQAALKDSTAASARFNAGLELLKQQPQTDPQKLAAIGYCFGGKIVLDAARQGLPLAGVVSFHGALATATPATPGSVKAKILVEHGAQDSMVTADNVTTFKTEMDKAGADYRFVSLEGAKHGFSNPDADRLSHGEHGGPDIGYNKAADERSWADMQAFFKKLFG